MSMRQIVNGTLWADRLRKMIVKFLSLVTESQTGHFLSPVTLLTPNWFKLCTTPGLTRRNSREAEARLVPTPARWNPACCLPRIRRAGRDQTHAHTPTPQLFASGKTEPCACLKAQASRVLSATRPTWASLLAEFEGYLRILEDKMFHRWYLANCKVLVHVNCNA